MWLVCYPLPLKRCQSEQWMIFRPLGHPTRSLWSVLLFLHSFTIDLQLNTRKGPGLCAFFHTAGACWLHALTSRVTWQKGVIKGSCYEARSQTLCLQTRSREGDWHVIKRASFSSSCTAILSTSSSVPGPVALSTISFWILYCESILEGCLWFPCAELELFTASLKWQNKVWELICDFKSHVNNEMVYSTCSICTFTGPICGLCDKSIFSINTECIRHAKDVS